MQKHLYPLLFLVTLISHPVIAQLNGQPRIDSLRHCLVNMKDDTNKVVVLNDICFTYYAINPDSGLYFGNQALRLAEKLNWKQGIANATGRIGSNYFGKSDYLRTLDYWLAALKLNEELGNKKAMAVNLGNIGNLYYINTDYSKALEYYSKALKISEEMGSQNLIAMHLGNIGTVYGTQLDYTKALDYFVKAYDLYIQAGDKDGITRNTASLANVYMGQKNYLKALELNLKSLNMAEESGDKSLTAIALINLAKIDLELSLGTGDSDAFKELKKRFGSNRTRALNEASAYANRAVALSLELGDLRISIESYKMLSDVQAKLGDYSGATQNFIKYADIKDSLFTLEKDKKLTETVMKYEFDKKALGDSLRHAAEIKDIDLLQKVEIDQKATQRNIFLSAAGILLILLFLFFQRKMNKNKLLAKEKEASYQKELLVATINSEEKERRRIARDLHDEIGAMLSVIKMNLGMVNMKMKKSGIPEDLTVSARDLLDNTITNVRKISKVLLPPVLEEFGLAQALIELIEKTENETDIIISKDINLDQMELTPVRKLALYRVVQELLSNAIKHAEANKIQITMKSKGGMLSLSFADNGKGFDAEAVKINKDGNPGFGLKNIENRIRAAGGNMVCTTSLGMGSSFEISVAIKEEVVEAA